MNITCNQFESLLSFYINDELSETLKNTFEEHLNNCHQCREKFRVLNEIIDDIKDAYNQFINKNIEHTDETDIEKEAEIAISELSAYIDNELTDDNNIKVRKNLIAKPKLRTKINKLYKLRKIIANSYTEHKKRLKTDYSKDIIKTIGTNSKTGQIYNHCILFILFVIFMICLSVWTVLHIT